MKKMVEFSFNLLIVLQVQNSEKFKDNISEGTVLFIHSADKEVSVTESDILKIKYTENRLISSGLRKMVFHFATSFISSLTSKIEIYLNT